VEGRVGVAGGATAKVTETVRVDVRTNRVPAEHHDFTRLGFGLGLGRVR